MLQLFNGSEWFYYKTLSMVEMVSFGQNDHLKQRILVS